MSTSTESIKTSLRERKKARTREALVEVAQRLFAEQGYESTTVEEIALAAEVSRRTFFRYFPSKEAVAFPENETRLARFREALATREGEAPFDAVRRACLTMAAEYAANAREIIAQHQIVESSATLIAAERRQDIEWEAAIADALMAAGGAEPKARRRAQVLAGAVMGVIRATLREWFDSEGALELVTLGSEAMDMLELGVHARRQPTR